MKILIASDFHGNKEQARTIHEAAARTSPDVFIYLGDLSPVREIFNTPEKAGRYVEENIFNEFKKLSVARKFVIPGNTDFLENCKEWHAQYRDPESMFFAYNERVELFNANCIFLSVVEETDHFLKDQESISRRGPKFPWMRFIFSKQRADGADFECENIKYGRQFTMYENYDKVDPELRARFDVPVYEQIRRLYRPNATNYIFSHCPAYDTNGDCMRNNNHVGSVDLKDFIAENHVDMLCAAHIHESCIYGTYRAEFNGCTLYTVGSGGIDYSMMEETYYLIIDTETGENDRFCIRCPKAEFGLNRSY